MLKKTIAVTSATGNIGEKLVKSLLQAGHHVRALGRSTERLNALVQLGAEPHVGDLLDTPYVTQAFKGADSVFLLIPPLYTAKDFRAYQNLVGDSLTQAVLAGGVTNVVNLSSLGAQHEEHIKIGPIRGLRDQEQRLNQLNGVHVIHLRPGYFFENVFASLGLVKASGILGSPVKANFPLAQIATVDIAEAAAQALVNGPFDGKRVVELAGAEDITMARVAETLGKAAGRKQLPYVEFSPGDTHHALVEAGLSGDMATNFVDLYDAINKGYIAPVGGRTRENTTKTRFEVFAKSVGNLFADDKK